MVGDAGQGLRWTGDTAATQAPASPAPQQTALAPPDCGLRTTRWGRLYARQDAVGTPYCVTVDVQTLADQQVTIRDRDTTEQVRLALDQVRPYIQDKLLVD